MSDLVPKLSQLLFADPEATVYAVLDGASVSGLLPELAKERPDHVCLYRGELKPDLAQCAPYLVRLENGKPFTNWILAQGWGKHWGIFAVSQADLKAMRKHFRTFLMVKTPEGKQVYFRYYDPRVLRVYLPTCNAQETTFIFGPVKVYCLEGQSNDAFLSFSSQQNRPLRQELSLTHG